MKLTGETSLVLVKAKVLSVYDGYSSLTVLIVDDGTKASQISYYGKDEFSIDKEYYFYVDEIDDCANVRLEEAESFGAADCDIHSSAIIK